VERGDGPWRRARRPHVRAGAPAGGVSHAAGSDDSSAPRRLKLKAHRHFLHVSAGESAGGAATQERMARKKRGRSDWYVGIHGWVLVWRRIVIAAATRLDVSWRIFRHRGYRISGMAGGGAAVETPLQGVGACKPALQDAAGRSAAGKRRGIDVGGAAARSAMPAIIHAAKYAIIRQITMRRNHEQALRAFSNPGASPK